MKLYGSVLVTLSVFVVLLLCLSVSWQVDISNVGGDSPPDISASSRSLRRFTRNDTKRHYVSKNITTPRPSQQTTKKSVNVHRKKRKLEPNRTIPCPSSYPQLFIWDGAKTPTWFEVFDLKEKTSDEEKRELLLATRNTNRIFHVSSAVAESHVNGMSVEGTMPPHLFNSSQFEYPNPFNSESLDVFFGARAARSKDRKMAVFKNVRVTEFGGIMKNDEVCLAVRNGGCNSSSRDTVSFASFQNDSIPSELHFSKVITLANFAQGTWHFPMELLVALANVDLDIVATSKIHVRSLDTKHYRAKWLNLIDIKNEDMIEGTRGPALVDTLFVPQMATYSLPFTSQLYWLRERVFTKFNMTHNNYGSHHSKAVDTAMEHPTSSSKRSIILIQRIDRRRLQDNTVISEALSKTAALLDYDFVVHTTDHGLENQFKKFMNAAIVLAPHGAGGLFINFSPPDLCFIEVISANEPLCFARLAYLRGQDYISVPRLHVFPRKANLSSIANAIRMCSLRGKYADDEALSAKMDDVLSPLLPVDVVQNETSAVHLPRSPS